MPTFTGYGQSFLPSSGVLVLLPNGKLLAYQRVAGSVAYIIDPDPKTGEYIPDGQVRTILGPDRTHHFNCWTLNNEGTELYLWGSEFDDNGQLQEPDYVTVFDIAAETFTSTAADWGQNGEGVHAGHQWVGVDAEGLGTIGRFSRMPDGANPLQPTAVLSDSTYTFRLQVEWRGNGSWPRTLANAVQASETGWALTPDDTLWAFNAASSSPSDFAHPYPHLVSRIAPTYSAAAIAAGAFDNGLTSPLTIDSSYWDRSTEVDAFPQTFRSGRFKGWRSDGYDMSYEVGGCLYSPLDGKVVMMGGNGQLWGVVPTDPPTVELLASSPIDADVGGQIGRIRAADNGKTVAAWAAEPSLTIDISGFEGRWASPLAPGQKTPGAFAAPWDQSPDLFFVITGGGTSVSMIRGATAGGSDGVNTLVSSVNGAEATFTGHTHINDDRPWDTTEPGLARNYGGTGTETISTGDPVCQGGPFPVQTDAGTLILPNGHLVFITHGGWGIRYWRPRRGQFVKWDGTSLSLWHGCAPGDVEWPRLVVSPGMSPEDPNFWPERFGTYTSGMLIPPAPSQSIFYHYNGANIRIDLDPAEKVAPGSYKPIIDTVSNVNLIPGERFTIAGRQLNGIHEGGAFGDDASLSNNVPIARFTRADNQVVIYGWTRSRTYRGIMPLRASTIDVIVPADAPTGVYDLEIVSSGVASDPYPVGIGTSAPATGASARVTMML